MTISSNLFPLVPVFLLAGLSWFAWTRVKRYRATKEEKYLWQCGIPVFFGLLVVFWTPVKFSVESGIKSDRASVFYQQNREDMIPRVAPAPLGREDFSERMEARHEDARNHAAVTLEDILNDETQDEFKEIE